jgi:hypothetical protein
MINAAEKASLNKLIHKATLNHNQFISFGYGTWGSIRHHTYIMCSLFTDVVIHVDGVRLCLCMAATNGPIVRPPEDAWVWRTMVEWYWNGKPEELLEKPVPVPIQIPHGPTRASGVKGQRLTAWAMARHYCPLLFAEPCSPQVYKKVKI